MSQPAENSTTTGNEHSVGDDLAQPGAITYLHMPAADPREAAVFYQKVFGWAIDDPDGNRPSFGDGSRRLRGAWLSEGLVPHEPGLLAFVYVDDVQETVSRIVAYGGQLVCDPRPEGLLTIATFRDPAGNVIGLWHDTTRSTRGPADAGKVTSASQTVSPVPERLHTVTARLALSDAASAIDFYHRAFNARELGDRYCAPDGTLIQAELQIGDSIVMVTEDDGYRALLCTYWPDVDSAWERALAAGAQVIHPLANHFYGERGGRIKDPYDQEWMLSARLENLTATEIAARGAAQH